MMPQSVRSLLAAIHFSVSQRQTLPELKRIFAESIRSDPLASNTALFIVQAKGKKLHEELWERCHKARKHFDVVSQTIAQVVRDKAASRPVLAYGDQTLLSSSLSQVKGKIFVIGKNFVGGKTYPFIAARDALKKTSLVLTSAFAITPDTIVQPLGSGILAELAKSRGIPNYCLAFGWHATKNTPKNPEYETVDPELVTGIISELGILPHHLFLEEVFREYPWIMKQP